MELGLTLTQRCNAQCSHCATDCGPSKRTELASTTIFALMDEAARLTPPGDRLDFSLTGGEIFLDLDYLVKILQHAVALRGTVSCVTNAYWASSDQRTQTTIRRVHEAGLSSLAVSTSRYHQRFVPIERVRRAVSAARSVGMTTLLKIAFTVPDVEEGLVESWSILVGADELQTFPVVPYLRNGAQLPQAHYVRAPGLPAGTCPAPSLSVREDGAAYTCCTPGAFEPLLRLGSVFDHSLEEIVAQFHFDPTLQVLRQHGPIHFARHAIASGRGTRLRQGYADECDLCAHIASDQELAEAARDCAREYRIKWADRISSQMRERRKTIS